MSAPAYRWVFVQFMETVFRFLKQTPQKFNLNEFPILFLRVCIIFSNWSTRNWIITIVSNLWTCSFASSQLLTYEYSRNSMMSSDYDVTGYNGASGGVVAYAGSHTTKPCADSVATDPLTYSGSNCSQMAANGKRRLTPTEVTSPVQSFEPQTSGYLMPNTASSCKRHRSVLAPNEFSVNTGALATDGFAVSATGSMNYGHNYNMTHQT